MVLLCLPGVHVDNVLALRTLEHRLAQHVFPQNGKLVCMWNVVDMVALAEPFAGVPAGLGASRQRSVVWRLNHLSRDAAAATCSCKDTGRSVRDQLVLWQQRFGLEDPLPLPEHVLSLPLQIAVLVSRGSWKVVYGAYPKHRRDARRHWCIFSGIQISDDVHLEERCDVLQRDEVVRICDAIRDVAPGANLAAQQTLERLARWADSLQFHVRGRPRILQEKTRRAFLGEISAGLLLPVRAVAEFAQAEEGCDASLEVRTARGDGRVFSGSCHADGLPQQLDSQPLEPYCRHSLHAVVENDSTAQAVGHGRRGHDHGRN